MPELEYDSQPGLIAAWNGLHEAIEGIEANPQAYVAAIYQLKLAFHDYHAQVDETYGDDDYGKCCLQLNNRKPLIVTKEQAEKMESLTVSFSSFYHHLHSRAQTFGHDFFLKYLFAKLSDEHSNNLKDTFNAVTALFIMPTRMLQLKDGTTFDLDEDYGEDYDVPQQFLVDYALSEDYFIDTMKAFINKLCDYIVTYPEATITHDRHQMVKALLREAHTLLQDRITQPVERFQQMAAKARELDTQKKGKLHDMVTDFLGKTPPLPDNKELLKRPYLRSGKKAEDIDGEILQIVTTTVDKIKETPNFFVKVVNFFISVFCDSESILSKLRTLKSGDPAPRMPHQ